MRSPVTTRMKRTTDKAYVPVGNITKMIAAVDEATPGAGAWILDQVPDGATLADVLRGLIVDAFLDDQEAIKTKLSEKVRATE